MFIPFISNFKITLSSKLSMYYFSLVIRPSLVLLPCKFTTITNNMIYTFIYFFTHSTQRISLAFFNLCFNKICYYIYSDSDLPLLDFLSPFSNLHSEAKLNTDHFLLLQPASDTFSSQSSNLFSFFDLFKTLAASKPSILSTLAACTNLSSIP